MSNNKKLIAFYLPQFHPTPRNDEWWGKGFTEWTNVGKAKPLFRGHYQPHVPADLGYYDLRLPEVRQAQADMAREYGVYGFCYYHYWFEAGFEELEKPFDDVVNLGQPDFPFCLCWANESWYSKFWNMDGTVEKKILAEQKYPGEKDNEAHFYRLLNAFKDKRYIKIDGRLLFVIYRYWSFEHFEEFRDQWNRLAIENGLPGFYFVTYTTNIADAINESKKLGFDNIISCRLYQMGAAKNRVQYGLKRWGRTILGNPDIRDYSKHFSELTTPYDIDEYVIPTIVPNWDHTPRSGKGGMVFQNANPECFEKHVKQVVDIIEKKNNQLCFLKSWNEWGEGNYVEPDLEYGTGFLEVIKKYFK